MTAFPKYPAYKESGVAWLGEVPEHWGIYPNRRLFEERKVPVGKRAHEYKLLSLTLNGVIPRDMENPKGKFPAEFNTYSEVEPNDLVFCLFDLDETPRTVGISPCPGMITGAYTIFKPKLEVNPKYQFYYYLSLDEQKALKPLYTGLRKTISRSTFASAKSPCPPRAEQDRIVAFLDEKTAQIDALIAKKQRQIELLDEQKAILINRAVTRGLHPNPDLQDSGIPWIGPIPKHWKLVQLKRCIREQEYGLSDPATDQGNYTYLGMGQIQNMEVIPDRANRLDKCPSHLLLRDKDILFNRTNSFDLVGKAGIYRAENFACSNPVTFASYLVRLRTSGIADPEWLNLLMGDALFLIEARSLALRSLNQANLTFSRLGQTYVPLPPMNEQLEIVNWTTLCFEKMATAAAAVSRQIQTLQTLRSTLIAHAVTGKIQVS